MDTTNKFDGLANDYTAGRPGYSAELIDYLYSEHGFSEASVIADIGSGTGKFAEYLLEKGSEVFCVEPNDDMRSEAENVLGRYIKFHSVKGGAEDTTLGDASVDIITTAQAFHWFDVKKFRQECTRIIRDNGIAALVWNVRDIDDNVNKELYAIFKKYCPDFKGFSGGIKRDDERIAEFFGGKYERVSFDAPIYYDRDKFISRCLSGSYSLKKGDCAYSEYISAVNDVFDKFSKDRIVKLGNKSVAYIGRIK